ncbi:MAG: hypothetical protein ACLTV6_06445 [Christensenellales bacterium]
MNHELASLGNLYVRARKRRTTVAALAQSPSIRMVTVSKPAVFSVLRIATASRKMPPGLLIRSRSFRAPLRTASLMARSKSAALLSSLSHFQFSGMPEMISP